MYGGSVSWQGHLRGRESKKEQRPAIRGRLPQHEVIFRWPCNGASTNEIPLAH
jgi:hypothetical protein